MARAVQIAALSVSLLLAACAPALRPRPELSAPTAPNSPSGAARPLPQPREQIVRSATAMLGQPYRYGGAAPGGFDCSGLVVYAVAGTGIRLPRTAEEQLRSGAPVSRQDIQAGDLVFMHLASKNLHVGIAVDNDRFIHAPATGGSVRIDSLSAPPYSRGYLTARRIVTAVQ